MKGRSDARLPEKRAARAEFIKISLTEHFRARRDSPDVPGIYRCSGTNVHPRICTDYFIRKEVASCPEEMEQALRKEKTREHKEACAAAGAASSVAALEANASVLHAVLPPRMSKEFRVSR